MNFGKTKEKFIGSLQRHERKLNSLNEENKLN